MSIITDIDAIAEDTNLSFQERKQQIRKLCVEYVRDRMHDKPFPWVFVRGNVTAVFTKVHIVKGWLSIWVYVTRNARDITPSLPILFNKPPLLVVDPLGDIVLGTPPNEIRCRLDPIEAMKNVLTVLIKNS